MEIKGINIRGKRESFGRIENIKKMNLNNITRKFKKYKYMGIMV
ncbi:hypothetical protein [Clostridium beijerinckii]|nr:hypothetical protein [Clostridium beijerinckii]